MKKICFNYLFLSVFCFISVLLVYSIPRTELMEKKMIESSLILSNEGIYKRAVIDMMLFDLDNLTNEIMLSKAAYYDETEILESALMNYSVSKNEILHGNYGTEKVEMYGRYWHGYLLFLKPALLLMNYNQIRYFNYFFITVLIFGIVVLLSIKINKRTAISFLISIMLVGCYIVPLSLQLVTMFYISLSAMLFILLYNRWLCEKGITNCFFFTIGGLTAFLDLLTIPMLSLGFPLLAFVLLNRKEKDWKCVFLLSLYWFCGYTCIWLTKWILVSLFTDYNMIKEAFFQILLRIGLSNEAEPSMEEGNILLARIYSTFINLSSNPVSFIILLIIVGLVLVYMVLPKVENAYKNNIVYIIIAFIPIIWYIVLSNHTGIHWRFTHRALAVTFFSMFLFIINVVDWKKIKQRL